MGKRKHKAHAAVAAQDEVLPQPKKKYGKPYPKQARRRAKKADRRLQKQLQQQQQQKQAANKAPKKDAARAINLPVNRKLLGHVPWMKDQSKSVIDLTQDNDDDNDNNNNESIHVYSNGVGPKGLPCPRQVGLPTDDFDKTRMQLFSSELRAFAAYARLTNVECQARQVMLERMHQVAVRIFQNSPEINVSGLELQVFGSFACKDVCTFSSDVDVALWGVVAPKVTKKHIRWEEEPEPSNAADSNTNPKDERKKKWLMALMDEENAVSPSDSADVVSEKTESIHQSKPRPTDDAGDLDSDDYGEDKEDLPLFVLDRTGVDNAPVKLQENNDTLDKGLITSASVSTQATVTESEASTEKKEEDQSDDTSSNSDDDSADKLTENAMRARYARVPTEANVARALPASNSESEAEDDESEEDTAVHFITGNEQKMEISASAFSRRKVVDGLQRFFRGLRNSGISNKIQLISRA